MPAYGWRTIKTDNGYTWQVYRVEYQTPNIILNQGGTYPTRAQAMGAAKKCCLKFRRERDNAAEALAAYNSPANH